MIDLRDHLTVGQRFTGMTEVQVDFHTFVNVHTQWKVTAVYPHWVSVICVKDTILKGKGSEKSIHRVPAGRRASFDLGDLVMNHIIDPFAANPYAAVRRI